MKRKQETSEEEASAGNDGTNGKKAKSPVITVVLTNSSLHTISLKNRSELLNDDDHRGILQSPAKERRRSKQKMTPNISSARPDIVHQCLMALLDSPLNKTGRLQIFLSTSEGKIVRVSPCFRVPRSWKIFSKVMVDFLTSPLGALHTDESEEPLLALVPHPLERHIEGSGVRVAIVPNGIPVRLAAFVSQLQHAEPSCWFISAASNRELGEKGFGVTMDFSVSISQFPLSSSVCCSRLTCEMESLLQIL